MTGDRNCQEYLDPDPFTKFLKRTINDFDGALAEFRQLTASLKQSGKIRQAQVALLPSGNSNDLIAGNVDEQPSEPLSSIDPSIPDDEPGRKGSVDRKSVV